MAASGAGDHNRRRDFVSRRVTRVDRPGVRTSSSYGRVFIRATRAILGVECSHATDHSPDAGGAASWYLQYAFCIIIEIGKLFTCSCMF